MDNFIFDDFIVDLKTTFNNKSARLSLRLKEADREQEKVVSGANEYHEFVLSLVESMLKNPVVRRRFDDQVYRMSFDEPDTLSETMDELVFLADVNWYLGLGLLNTNKSEAIKCLLLGIEYLDYCRGLEDQELWQQQQTTKLDVPVQGGRSKAARFDPVKDRIISLLQEYCPPGGWESKQDAIRGIENGINELEWPSARDRNNLSKSGDEIFAMKIRQVEVWSSRDPKIEAAFDCVVKPKKK
ncbi:Uncharacterised protein [Yersinia intermedia]|uniref:hypothetical protein n=1 Tax=Yersinia pseudotuberculosis TaxID=633 RepID=UPI000173991E|nr:hypothetical protein [Yersinia pseudotuberculosis]AJJ67730.1 hypothetical protein BZ16_516 [Yersinia pseudotuberculosis PB1/+]CQD50554.1 Uncharacterised protein [Yersinia intermedia]